ncbi:MAG: ABC transporter substrate-binding protein [Prevotella sp.]|nr:ABC transporter substrate-binding protein [Prevotella sp.]
MRIEKKIYGYVLVALVIMHVALMLCSWIINAISPSLQVKSILSNEGIRWLCGSFTENLLTPLLAWILLLSIAWGAFTGSGFGSALSSLCKGHRQLSYRQRYALLTVVGELVVFGVIIYLLTFVPHAILLGVTGCLYPSAFTTGLIPMLAFVIVVISVTYGIINGVFVNIEGILGSFYVGIITFVPLLILYLFAVQLYSSIVFVFF